MVDTEAKFITAVCRNEDSALLFADEVDRYFVSHKDIWQHVKDYWFKYKTLPDVELLQDEFRDFEVPAVTGDARHHLDQLRNQYVNTNIRGLLMAKSKDLQSGKPGAEILHDLFAQVSDLARDANVVRDIDVTDAEAARAEFERRMKRAQEHGGLPGIATGFQAIDVAYPTGMAPGHLIVLIGWSGRGKTWFSSYMACKAWLNGYRPMIVSMEMTPESMRDRIYTILGSGIFKNSDLIKGDLDLDRFDKWASSALKDKNQFVIVSSEGAEDVSPNTIQGKIDQHRPDLVIVDYHQLLNDNSGNGNEVQRMRNISRELKRLAVRNAIPIVDLSQATQSQVSDTDSPPLIEQVTGSKGIQHDADLAIAVHKYPDTNLFDIISRKNRHGDDFAFQLEWDINAGRIQEIYDTDDDE